MLLWCISVVIVTRLSHSRVMLLLIKMVMEYCQCTDDLPMLVTEVLGKLVDMMKVRVRVCVESKEALCTHIFLTLPCSSSTREPATLCWEQGLWRRLG